MFDYRRRTLLINELQEIYVGIAITSLTWPHLLKLNT